VFFEFWLLCKGYFVGTSGLQLLSADNNFEFEAFSSILRFFVLGGAWNGLRLAKAWSLRRFAFEVVKEFDVFLHCFDVILRIFDVFLRDLVVRKIFPN
jgi:hypothetical protein